MVSQQDHGASLRVSAADFSRIFQLDNPKLLPSGKKHRNLSLIRKGWANVREAREEARKFPAKS
jgi:hypothetical protein